MKISCLQTNSRDSIEENLSMISPMVKQAYAEGANVIALPENCFLMAHGRKFHEHVTTEAEHHGIATAQEWAQEYGCWIILGSVAVKETATAEKYANRQIVISPKGNIAARYDKIHLFDVEIEGGESHQESARFNHGKNAVTTQIAEQCFGLSICYDVRFPSLYRSLAKAGANILTIPAAFTRFTGEKGGWHVLCRARAMETGCFVIAPAQCGQHSAQRKTYGHSLIINPWGEVLAEGGATEPGIISAEINLALVEKTRQSMPSLKHDRDFTIVNESC